MGVAMSETLTITMVVLISGKALTPDPSKRDLRRPHTLDEGGVTFFLPQRTERIHVPWTSILYLETKP